MKKWARQYFHRIFARKELVTLWGVLYKLSLHGMNYGFSDSPSKSGERSVLNILKKRKPCNGTSYTIVDVGANYGQYLNLVRSVIPNYRAFLFEPSDDCYRHLVSIKNSNIQVFNFPLGDAAGHSRLYFGTPGSVLGSLVPVPGEDFLDVEVTTLDDFWKEEDEIDLLVIDTEGFEKNVLLGAKTLISNHKVKMIQFEHGSGRSILNTTFLRDFYQILVDYDIFHIKQNGIIKIIYAPEMEIFYNTNYLAILKKARV